MKRKDMEQGVMYAIARDGYNVRPGFVLDPGTPPDKVKVRVFWSWQGPINDEGMQGETDYLETDTAIIAAGKYDDSECGTGGVVMLWSEYVAEKLAERQAWIDKQEAEQRAEQERKDRLIARATKAGERVGHVAYYDRRSWKDELIYRATHGYEGERVFSLGDVLGLIEQMTGVEAAPAYELECYGCGRKGTNETFGLGNSRKCPDCGSMEVHAS